ncbi:hypothetical protein GGI23_000225 [Coemansia sp. RSA 2559]|nr:hypothetical protein GGI23_000225 [Coemansia sp. RSA 2559]
MSQLFRGLFATAVALSCFCEYTESKPVRLSTRTVGRSDLLNYHGAVLVKNGIETSCDIALIDNKAAFVAASCIEMTNGAVDTSVQHEVYFDQYGNNNPAKTSVASTDIHIHPSYNKDTLANNIAILEFDFTDQGSWTNSIAVYPDEWTDTIFVRRQLIDASTSTWALPQLKSNTINPSTCSTYSTIFGNNADGMRCNSIQINSVWNSKCPFPYGAFYGEIANTSLAIGGLHSYTLMPTSDYCNGDRGLYYFTMLYNYVEWAESVIGRSISTLVADTSAYDATSKSASFSMNDSNDYNPKDWYFFSSNMRFPALWNPDSADADYLTPSSSGGGSSSTSSSSSSSGSNNASVSGSTSATNESESDKVSETGDSNSDLGDVNTGKDTNESDGNGGLVSDVTDGAGAIPNGKSYEGLSKGAIIAIAVSVPLGVIVLAVAAFFVYKQRRTWEGRVAHGWGKPGVKSQNAVNDLVGEIGGATENDNLPSYDELHESFRDSNGAARESSLPSPNTTTFEKYG